MAKFDKHVNYGKIIGMLGLAFIGAMFNSPFAWLGALILFMTIAIDLK